MSRKPILHPVGNTNPKHTYHINGKELASFDNYRDLGVTVSFDLQLLESVQRGATRVPFGRSRLQYTVKKKKKRRPGARLLYQIKECEIAHNHQDAWFAKN
jgi:hypothetical protein